MTSILASRSRLLARTLNIRQLSSTVRRLTDPDHVPKPPPPIDDSTSALDYKTSHRARPPPLPAMDSPRSRTAEEAVTNILYNTPPPSLQPFKRMCLVLRGQDGVVEQARRQLEDLVPVWAVLDYTNTNCIERELLLAKVSILGPDYIEDQYQGGPTHEARRSDRHHSDDSKLEREVNLVHNFERGVHPEHDHSAPAPLTPTQVLRLKSDHLQSLSTLSDKFGARIVDVSENSIIVEMSGKTVKVEAFLSLLKPFGLLESARTGLMAMPRTPFKYAEDGDEVLEEGGAVDASLLPPG
ncbi:hypothetical protein PHLCEN_2v12370 [Hermanssonia centrifuga]|uniref:Acetolactate synthase small subunit C-terminal domain-containing protein n=1 Tax=Hermanssonia centrifuga TaxID=98765 RepID=A0A2R6NHA3_9APHY|nr:hypothetical protein PHLCEN_2v12370 [Hermanssonia centrifuga]